MVTYISHFETILHFSQRLEGPSDCLDVESSSRHELGRKNHFFSSRVFCIQSNLVIFFLKQRNRFQSIRTSSISTEDRQDNNMSYKIGKLFPHPEKQKPLALLSTMSIEEDVSLQEEDKGFYSPSDLSKTQKDASREKKKSGTLSY